MFITFEGIDHSGKGTQIKRLQQWLDQRGDEYLLVREPGGHPVSEAIRDMLLDIKNHDLIPESELLLYAAARAQLVKSVIKPALAAGKIVIADRFYDSTTAYQGFGRGIDSVFIRKLNVFAAHDLRPDITFLLDIPVTVSYARAKAADNVGDRMEQSGNEFYEKVRNGYLEIADQEPRVRVIDATQPVDSIAWEIGREVERRLTPANRS